MVNKLSLLSTGIIAALVVTGCGGESSTQSSAEDQAKIASLESKVADLESQLKQSSTAPAATTSAQSGSTLDKVKADGVLTLSLIHI